MIKLSSRLSKLEASKYNGLYRISEGGFIGMPLSNDFSDWYDEELEKANFDRWFNSLPQHLQQRYIDETEARTKYNNESFKYWLEDAAE